MDVQHNALYDYNAAIIKERLITNDHIYFDLSLVRDYFIGTLMFYLSTLPPDQAELKYQYIQSEMKPYHLRKSENVEHLFPKLGLSQKQFNIYFHDQNNHDIIFSLSPTTEYVGIIKTLLSINVNHSKVAEKFTKDYVGVKQYRQNWKDITFYINTFPLVISNKAIQKKIQSFFADNYLVNVALIYQDPLEFNLPLLKVLEEYHIKDLDRFLRNPIVKKTLESDDFTPDGPNFFRQKRIFSPFIIDHDKIKNEKIETLAHELQKIKSGLDLLCREFDWIPNAHIALDLSLFQEEEIKE